MYGQYERFFDHELLSGRSYPGVNFRGTSHGAAEVVTREELVRGFDIRPVEERDLEQVSSFMYYWLITYQECMQRQPETLAILQKVFERNMEILRGCASGTNEEGYHFFIAEDENERVAGATGFITHEHIDPRLLRVLQETGTFTLPDGSRSYDLNNPAIPELYFLYTHPGKEYRGRNLGRILMNGCKKNAHLFSGSDIAIFSSRQVWQETSWHRFHDLQPDFHLVCENIDTVNPLEANTRAYLVTDCSNPVQA